MRSRLRLAAALALCACGQPATDVPAAEGADQNEGSAADDPSDDGQTDGDGDGDPNVCETLELRVAPRDPEILVVLDRSGSMAGEAWNQAILAIDALIAAFPGYRFGLSMYPAVGEELDCKPGKLDVTPGEDTGTAIHETLHDPAAEVVLDRGYTPTSATLRAAEPYLTTQLDVVQDRFVLLVTDGQPNCNAAGPAKATEDLAATLDVLADLAAQHVPTFVFGYRTEALATVMDQMAAAGGTVKHHAVEDDATILAAFEALGSSLAACTFELDEAAPGPEFVRVRLDGVDLALDSDGFTLEGEKTIRLGGDACAALRDGSQHAISVSVECEPVRLL
jgi:hypothetical protein